MSAGLTSSDSMFSVRVTPWHGLGAVLDRPPATVAEAIEAAGLGWGVVKKALATDLGSDLPDVLRYKRFPGYYATVRQDTGEELGVVGERRTAPSPNRLIWRGVCQGSSLSDGVVVGVAGALAGRHGRKVRSVRLRGQAHMRGLVPQDPCSSPGSQSRNGRRPLVPVAHSRFAGLRATVLGLPVCSCAPRQPPGRDRVGVVVSPGSRPPSRTRRARERTAIATVPVGLPRSCPQVRPALVQAPLCAPRDLRRHAGPGRPGGARAAPDARAGDGSGEQPRPAAAARASGRPW